MLGQYGIWKDSPAVGNPVHFITIADELQKLEKSLHVSIEVSGSLSRTGEGTEVELILTSTETHWETFKRFIPHTLKVLRVATHARSVEVGHLFGHRYTNFESLMFLRRIVVDAFVFPRKWRARIPEIQGALPFEDPNVLERIARDAKPLKELCALYSTHP